MIRLLCIAFAAIIAMSVLATAVAPRRTATTDSPRTVGNPPGAASIQAGGSSEAMVLRRDTSGQFHITGSVRGEETRFLVDTGADLVALTEETADRLGVLPGREEFEPIMQTASGTGMAARIQLESLEVAGSEFRNVDAVVVEGLNTNLLGQSVLRQLGKVELQGDRMVIRQP